VQRNPAYACYGYYGGYGYGYGYGGAGAGFALGATTGLLLGMAVGSYRPRYYGGYGGRVVVNRNYNRTITVNRGFGHHGIAHHNHGIGHHGIAHHNHGIGHHVGVHRAGGGRIGGGGRHHHGGGGRRH